MKRFSLLLIAIPAGLGFVFLFFVTRLAYFHNSFFQRNHIALGLLSLFIAAVIFKLNYKPGKKR